MTYFLIALLVALAIAPLLHFLPSKRQRKQAQLRERAALSGLFEGSCGVYWREEGDADTVDRIGAALKAWTDQV